MDSTPPTTPTYEMEHGGDAMNQPPPPRPSKPSSSVRKLPPPAPLLDPTLPVSPLAKNLFKDDNLDPTDDAANNDIGDMLMTNTDNKSQDYSTVTSNNDNANALNIETNNIFGQADEVEFDDHVKKDTEAAANSQEDFDFSAHAANVVDSSKPDDRFFGNAAESRNFPSSLRKDFDIAEPATRADSQFVLGENDEEDDHDDEKLEREKSATVPVISPSFVFLLFHPSVCARSVCALSPFE